MWKYFVGCVSYEAVKKTYRELAKIHHPDRGGNEDTFKEVSNEYSKITAYSSFPISNPKVADFANSYSSYSYWSGAKNAADDFKAAADMAERQRAARAKYAKQKEQEQEAKRKAEEIRRKHMNNPWYVKEATDGLYQALAAVVRQCIEENRSNKWLVMEIYKLDDLELDHFKYVKYKLANIDGAKFTITDSTVTALYKTYLNIKDTEFDVERI